MVSTYPGELQKRLGGRRNDLRPTTRDRSDNLACRAGKKLSVGDGDTLFVNESGIRRTIRLACIDAPETAQSLYGSQARAALQAIAPVGSSLTVKGGIRDRHGRTVAEVCRGNSYVNLEVVRRGDASAGVIGRHISPRNSRLNRPDVLSGRIREASQARRLAL